MRTLLNEVQEIEAHLLKRSSPGDALVFEAQLILDDELQEKVHYQQKTYELISFYGRRQLKREIEAVHQKLFTQTEYRSFATRILNLFKTK
ncbi:hypothetical protein KXQ82_01915 [Mucilaginibacter sp. HMF5004]|uniref:hypothetical protein n=1 Tax=Mucilaginibacter rivuli TaxID=2857527 RepID=UPI001C5FDAE3|nr:hypothetical protein [Mucilaginibacter rivuli]MBW4888447.1 hypothetical protein [Mucilaginibacter rivuli]